MIVDPVADTVRNLMGLFDNAVERRRRRNDPLYAEAIQLGRRAIEILDNRDKTCATP
ncbi:hypothetical protein LAV_00182 [Sphingobium phage Lacusarx]|uniref:Uncharacterized protein n=1 Tax=Sphingobium phage Lacusarx TaxID=1980139 RepID=A0A1W6DX17_9CAUD|nr:hypothetical protein FDH44_gp121 [Sphingobium phage Lacusarx]ARK07557.1 hypothetical protein LAV_00182 [Sphingobium phage Lacusarx]